jgi:hypothetical protein
VKLSQRATARLKFSPSNRAVSPRRRKSYRADFALSIRIESVRPRISAVCLLQGTSALRCTLRPASGAVRCRPSAAPYAPSANVQREECRKRAEAVGRYGGYDEKEQALNQLLAELDGFDPTSGVILIGATNRPEVLDPALLRPRRFDRQVLVDRPDRSGRLQILKVHVAKVRLADGVDLDQIAGLTTGFTGADLANLVNEAAIVATRRKADAVTFDDFTAAIERIDSGRSRRRKKKDPRSCFLTAGRSPNGRLASVVDAGRACLGAVGQRRRKDRSASGRPLPRHQSRQVVTPTTGSRLSARGRALAHECS